MRRHLPSRSWRWRSVLSASPSPAPPWGRCNYDIVSGITAGVLAVWLGRGRAPRWVVASWNILGFVLLVNIVTVAVVSTPLFGWFGKERLNTFVTYPPFVWLPAVLVVAALMGHILVLRWLSAKPAS
jgi:hypothetical protein